MKFLFSLLLVSLLFVGCTDDKTTDNANAADKKTATAKTDAEKPSGAATSNSIKLTPFPASPEFKDAKIESVEYKSGTFNFGVGGGSYKLGAQTSDAAEKMCANSAKGQHIHLIMNNEPYAAKYDASFAYDLPDGPQVMLAFLSRSYHESIKTDEANYCRIIDVKDKTIVKTLAYTAPSVFYSRPKGTYKGKKDTEKVMLDFYIKNVEMNDDGTFAEGHKILVNINGQRFDVDKWGPSFIEGLPMGENTVALTLLDAKGAPVDSPHSHVSRTFTLEADPITDQ